MKPTVGLDKGWSLVFTLSHMGRWPFFKMNAQDFIIPTILTKKINAWKAPSFLFFFFFFRKKEGGENELPNNRFKGKCVRPTHREEEWKVREGGREWQEGGRRMGLTPWGRGTVGWWGGWRGQRQTNKVAEESLQIKKVKQQTKEEKRKYKEFKGMVQPLKNNPN